MPTRRTKRKNAAGIVSEQILLVVGVVLVLLVIVGSFYLTLEEEPPVKTEPSYLTEPSEPSSFPTAEEYEAEQTQRAEEDQKVMEAAFKKLVARHGGVRVEFTDEVRTEFMKILNEEYPLPVLFNTEPFNQLVPVRLGDLGIRVSLPFNDAWGNEYVKPMLFESRGGSIDFGPLGIFCEGGCGFIRPYSLAPAEPASVQSILADYEGSSDKELYSMPPTVKKMGNVQIVSSVSSGFCTFPQVTIIGQERNFNLTTLCGDEEDIPLLEQIAATVEFL